MINYYDPLINYCALKNQFVVINISTNRLGKNVKDFKYSHVLKTVFQRPPKLSSRQM